jgi:CHASE2 domain-containing sensor protein
MSAKLALQYLKVTGHDFAGKPGFWPHIISTVKPAKRLNPASPIRTASFLVDYGAVERLRGQTAIADVCGGDVKFFPRTDFRGKVVILGNTQWETTLDKYPIPPWQREVPGVYFHSSGVYTLIQGALREPTKPLGEVLFDVLAVMLVTALILGIERALHNRFSEERIRWLAIWIVVIAVAFWGYWMIRSTRILWTDWLWVCLALLIHGWMERHTKRHSRTLRGAFLHFLSGEGKESAA